MTKFKVKALVDIHRKGSKDKQPVALVGKEYEAVDNGKEFLFRGEDHVAVSMPWETTVGDDPLFSVVDGIQEHRSGGYIGEKMSGYMIIGSTEAGGANYKSAKQVYVPRDSLQFRYANLTEREALTTIQDQLHEEGYTCVYITEIKELSFMMPKHERDEDNKLIASSAQKFTCKMDSNVSFFQNGYFFDEENPVAVIHDENGIVSFKHRGEDAPDFVFKTQNDRKKAENDLWETMRQCGEFYFKRPDYDHGAPFRYEKLEGANDPHEAYMTEDDKVVVKRVDGTETVIGSSGKLDMGWKFLEGKAKDE
ncbi:hypothetical protein BSP12_168 [Bacillus phage BSP12]|nr:hypothetical protein BSP12_168 [Bacillus phage BSP12]